MEILHQESAKNTRRDLKLYGGLILLKYYFCQFNMNHILFCDDYSSDAVICFILFYLFIYLFFVV